jgi:hypothetical protein
MLLPERRPMPTRADGRGDGREDVPVHGPIRAGVPADGPGRGEPARRKPRCHRARRAGVVDAIRDR